MKKQILGISAMWLVTSLVMLFFHAQHVIPLQSDCLRGHILIFLLWTATLAASIGALGGSRRALRCLALPAITTLIFWLNMICSRIQWDPGPPWYYTYALLISIVLCPYTLVLIAIDMHKRPNKMLEATSQ